MSEPTGTGENGTEPDRPTAPAPPGWSANQPPPAWVAPSGPTGEGGPAAGQGPGGPAQTAGAWGGQPPSAGQAGWSQPPGGGQTGSGQAGQPGWGQPGWGQPGGAQPGGAQPGWGQPAWGQLSAPDQPGWAWGQPYAAQVKPGIIPLRPLGVGELLDGAVSAIRRNPGITLLIGAAVGLLSQVFGIVATVLVTSDLEQAANLEPNASAGEVMDAMAGVMAIAIVSWLATWTATLIATGLLTVVVGRQVINRPVTLGEAWAAARPRLLRLAGLSVIPPLLIAATWVAGLLPGILLVVAGGDGAGALGALLLVVGSIAAVIFSVYLYVSFAVASAALMLEKQPVVASLRRSRRLVRGSWWRVFGILLLATIIAFFVQGIISFPFSIVGGGLTPILDPTASYNPSLLSLAISGLGGIIASMITLPFSAAITVLLYVDLRIRREALDIELARAAGVSLPGAPVPPAQTGR